MFGQRYYMPTDVSGRTLPVIKINAKTSNASECFIEDMDGYNLRRINPKELRPISHKEAKMKILLLKKAQTEQKKKRDKAKKLEKRSDNKFQRNSSYGVQTTY